jgi:hypothetical protein
MVVVQTLLALLSRSLGTITSALFGWAVVALFGPTSPREKMWLSALVGAAAAWPLLLIGVVWPRLATLVLAFVPLPHNWVPTWVIRLIWIFLAVGVPFALGMAMAARARGTAAPIPGTASAAASPGSGESARQHSPLRESKIIRLLRGVPITLGVAASFFIVFISVPVRRVVSIARRQVELNVPLVTDAKGYGLVAKVIAVTLERHGLAVQPAEAPWTVTAPSRILSLLGGLSFREYVPEQFARFRGPRLDVMLYPNGLLLRGSEQDTAWAHGLVVEALTDAPAYQTFDPSAQDIERQIRSVWSVFRQYPTAHVGAPALETRLDEIAREIRELPVGYDEWQIVYRQALQLDRALRGRPQLLEATAATKDEWVKNQPPQEANMANGDARTLSTRALLVEITEKVTLLARKEVELAKTEIKADLQAELSTAKGLGVAALGVVLGLNMLLVALVLALAAYMPAWLAALLLGGGLLLIGGIVGYVSWTRRVTKPLAVTRKTLKEDVQWAKERLA